MFKPEAYIDSVIDLLDDEQTLVAENIVKSPLDMQERYMSLVPDDLLDFIVKQWRPGMTSNQADQIFRKYSSFKEGGSVTTPKRGLVDEPGSYSQTPNTKGYIKPLTPEEEKLFKITNPGETWGKGKFANFKTRSNWKFDVKRKLDILKKTKGLITEEELSKILTEKLGENITTTKVDGRYGTGKYTDFGKVSKDLFKGTYGSIKGGKNVGGSLRYYRPPNKSDIKKYKDVLSHGNLGILKQSTVDAILKLDKNYSQLYREGNLPLIKDVVKKLKINPSLAGRATARLAQIYGGHKFKNKELQNIRKNVFASNKLFAKMEAAPFGDVYRSGVYDAALDTIDEKLGNKRGTFASLKAKARKILSDNKIKGFNINEIAGVTGSSRSGAEFSKFIDIMEKNLNQKTLANLQGQLSKARQKIVKGGNFKEIADDFNIKASALEKKYKIELPKIIKPEDVISSYGVKRLEELKKQGLDLVKAAERDKYGISVPKGALTIQEFTDKDNKRVKQLISAVGCPDFKGKQVFSEGGRTGFSEGKDCYLKGVEKINSGKIAKGAEAKNFVKFANQAYKLGRNVMRFGVLPEMVWIGGETLLRMGMGEGLDESFAYATSFLPGGSAREKKADFSSLAKTVGLQNAKTIMNVRGANESREKLNDLYNSLETDLAFAGGDWQAQADIEKRYEKRIEDAEKEYNIKSDFGRLDDISSGANIAARRLEEEAKDIKKSKSPFTRMRNWADEIRPDTVEGDIETILPSESDLDIGKTKTVPLFTMEDIAKNFIFDQYAEDPKEKLKILQGMREEDVNPGETDLERILFEQQSGMPTVNEFVWRDIFSKATENPAYAEQLYGASGMMGEPIQNSIIRANQAFPKTYGTFASGGIASLTRTIPPKKGPNSQGLAYLKKYVS